MQSDKIFREVNALSRLSHRNIVRYYTTWVETLEPTSATSANSDESETDSSTEARTTTEEEEGLTSVPYASELDLPINGAFNLDDLSNTTSVLGSSFPSIHFTTSANNSEESSSSEGEDQDEFGDLFNSSSKSKSKSGPASLVLNTPKRTSSEPSISRTLYIQMVCFDFLWLSFFSQNTFRNL